MIRCLVFLVLIIGVCFTAAQAQAGTEDQRKNKAVNSQRDQAPQCEAPGFEALDSNKDGVISWAEWDDFYNPKRARLRSEPAQRGTMSKGQSQGMSKQVQPDNR